MNKKMSTFIYLLGIHILFKGLGFLVVSLLCKYIPRPKSHSLFNLFLIHSYSSCYNNKQSNS